MSVLQGSTQSYVLHGLRVSANHPIPGLLPVEHTGPPDLNIQLGASPFRSGADNDRGETADAHVWFESPYMTSTGQPVLTAHRLQNGRYLRITYYDGVTFVLDREVTTVWVTWPPHLTLDYIPSYLLGPIIGVVLRLRGVTCLHASGIVVDDHAVIFAGREGSGKSTTAAAFGMRGFPVLADDTIALRRTDTTWSVAPGYPRVRLWPEAANAVAGSGRSPFIAPAGESGAGSRYHLDLVSAKCFQTRPVPVRLIYMLQGADGDSMSIAPFSPADAVAELVGNTFATRTLSRAMRADEFADLSELVNSVPVRRLSRPGNFEKLSEFCHFVLRDLQTAGVQPAAVAR